MPQYVEFGNTGQIIEFPDNTSPETIKQALSSFNPSTGSPKLKQDSSGISFLNSVKAGIENLGNAGTAIKAGVADLFGDEVTEEAAVEQYQNNQQKIGELLQGATDWRDIMDASSFGEGFGRTLDFVKEQFGLNSPQMVAILAGGAGGAAVAPYLPHPVATAVSKVGGFTIGATMTALPMFTGFNVGRQIDEGLDPDIVKAGALAIPQAATEALLARVFTTTGLTKLGESVLGSTSKSMLKRTGQKLGELLAIGVPSEVVQQGFERASADLEVLPWESEEAFDEYLDTAIAAAAALAPMSAIGILPPKAEGRVRPKRDQKELEKILQEEVKTSPEPAQNIIQTPEEAVTALESIGINPNIFTPEAQIKAANLFIDKIDNNRTKFFNDLIPAGDNLKSFLQQSSALHPLKQAVESKIPLETPNLEALKTDRDIKQLADILPKEPIVLSYPISLDIDTDASTEVLMEQGRVTAQTRQRLFRGPDFAQRTTISDIPGQIVADFESFNKPLKDLFKLPKEELVKKAKETYKISEEDLKDKLGKELPKREIISKIAEERAKTEEPFQPKPIKNPEAVQPLAKVTPEGIDAVVQKAKLLKPPSEVVAHMKPIVAQINRVFKEIKSKLNFDSDLKLDGETGEFTKPLRAAQAANYLFTIVNFNNVSNYPNMDAHLQETWEYFYDKLPEEIKKNLLSNLDKLKESIAKDYGIGKFNIELWSKSEQGQREVMSHSFARFAQAVRTGQKDIAEVPKEFQSQFKSIIQAIEKSKNATKGLGFSSFESVFPKVSIEGITPREAVFQSIEALRYERLKTISDNIQVESLKSFDPAIFRKNLDDKFSSYLSDEDARKQKGPLSMAHLGYLYNHKIGSAKNLASKNPLFSAVFALVQKRDSLQSAILTEIREAGRRWLEEPSKEVRYKAADIIHHLAVTGQTLKYTNEGYLMFARDGQQVIIKHPVLIENITSLTKAMEQQLSLFEYETRVAFEHVLSGALNAPLSELKKSVQTIETDKSESTEDISLMKDYVELLDQIKDLKGKPYLPELRFGEYGFTVHLRENLDPKENRIKKGSKPVYHAHVESGRFKGRFDKDSFLMVDKELEKYRNNSKYVVYSGYELTQKNILSKLGQDDVTLEMLSGLLGSDKSLQYYQDIKNWLDSKTKYSGFKKHFDRSNHIPGFSQDWDRVLSSFVGSSSHFLAKSRVEPFIRDIGNRVYGGDTRNPTKGELGDLHKTTKKAIADYIEYISSPYDTWQTIRQINFAWTMGFNPSSGLLQFMTLPTSTITSMSQYDANVYSNAKRIQKNFNIAFNEFSNTEVAKFENGSFIFELDGKEFLSLLKTKYKFSDDKLNFIVKMYRSGRFGATNLEEQAGKKDYSTVGLKGKIKEGERKLTNLFGIFVSGAEQATRFATLLAHYDMFMENSNAVDTALRILENDYRFQAQREVSGLSLIEDLSLFGMDEAHAVFGKVGRAPIMRNGWGAFVFPFQTYPQQIVEFAFSLFGRGPEGKRAAAVFLTSMIFFSGMMGLPGGELAKELIEALYKLTAQEDIDLEYEFRKMLTESTGSPKWGMFATQGIGRALFDLDVSKRIGLPIVGQDLLLAAMGVRGDMTEIAGVQGTIATQALAAWSAFQTDESGLKIGAMLTPTALANVLRAVSYYDEGVRTARGTQLVSKEAIQNHPVEVFMRAMGITTGRIASAREEQYWKQMENNAIKPKMNSFRARGKNYATNRYEALKEGNEVEAEKWRVKYLDLIKEVSGYLNKKKIPYDMGAFHTSVFNAVDQRAAAGVRLEDLNKGLRHKKKTLEKVSGRELYE